MQLESFKNNKCPLCNGSGWVIEDAQSSSSSVVRCSCYLQRRSVILLKEANIPKRYINCTLENFETNRIISREPHHLSPAKAQLTPAMAKDVVQDFIQGYTPKNRGLLLMGNCGVGKTHLAVALILSLMKSKGVSCLFYDFRDLLNEIRASYKSNSKTVTSNILRPVFEKEIVVLDELGAEKITEWTRDTLNYILNKRYNDNKTTIITSNWLDEAEADEETLADRIGYRMRSRLYEMCRVIEIVGDDYRMRDSNMY